MGSGTQLTITEDDAYALAARGPGDPGRGAARCAATGRSCSATATGRRRSTASRPTTWRRGSGKSSSGRPFDQSHVDSAGEGRAARPDRRAGAVRRRRPGRRDRAHPPRAAHGDRRARPQGPEHDRPGPGRRRADPDLDGAQARAGRQRRSRPATCRTITVRVRDGADIAATEQEMRELLRQRHKLQPSQEDDFFIRNLSEVLAAQEASSKILALLLAAIASVSLVVGGIGIMNIMLVSVTERTREIGLRMAVGARGRDILTQFLVEAVTLALIGGLIGIALGAIASYRGRPLRRLAHRDERGVGAAGLRLLRRGRRVLRLLSGAHRGAARARSTRCGTSRRGAPPRPVAPRERASQRLAAASNARAGIGSYRTDSSVGLARRRRRLARVRRSALPGGAHEDSRGRRSPADPRGAGAILPAARTRTSKCVRRRSARRGDARARRAAGLRRWCCSTSRCPARAGSTSSADLRLDYPRRADRRALGDARPRDGQRRARRRRARLHRQDAPMPQMLLDAVRHVLARRRVPSPTRHRCPTRDGVARLPVDALGLTQRQTDVLKLLAQGKPNKLICRDLRSRRERSRSTSARSCKALHVHSRTQAIVELARRGISVDSSSRRLTRGTAPMDADRARARRHVARCWPARAPTRSRRSTRAGIARRVDAARRGAVCAACCGSRRRPLADGGVAGAHPRQPGVARRAGARLAPRAAGTRRRRARWGALLGGRLDARRRAVGRRRGRDVPGVALAPGAAHRLPVRRGPGRAQPHRRLQAVVLRLRAPRAGAADRARGLRGRPGAPVHRAGDGRRAGVRAGVRASGERRADPIAGDALRERRPHRRAQGADARRARRARRGRRRPTARKSQLLAAASHDLRQPLHALGLFAAALAARAREPELATAGRAACSARVDALEAQFAQLLDLSRLEAGALDAERDARRPRAAVRALAANSRRRRDAQGPALCVRAHAPRVVTDPVLLERICATSSPTRCATRRAAASSSARGGAAATFAIDVVDTGVGIAPEHRERDLRRVLPGAPTAADRPRAGAAWGWASRSCAGSRSCSATTSRSRRAPGRGSRFRIASPGAAPRTRRRRACRRSPARTASLAGTRASRSSTTTRRRSTRMRALFATWGAADRRRAATRSGRCCVRWARPSAIPDLIVADLRLADGASGHRRDRALRDELGEPVPALIVSGDTCAPARHAQVRGGRASCCSRSRSSPMSWKRWRPRWSRAPCRARRSGAPHVRAHETVSGRTRKRDADRIAARATRPAVGGEGGGPAPAPRGDATPESSNAGPS